MAVRTAYVPTAATAITAANHLKFPGGWIGYVEVTASQATITSEVDLTSLTLTPTVGTSRRILTTLSCDVNSTVANNNAIVKITDGSNVQQARGSIIVGSTTLAVSVTAMRVEVASGAITRKARMVLNGGSGSVGMEALSTYPAFLLIEDMGPSA